MQFWPNSPYEIGRFVVFAIRDRIFIFSTSNQIAKMRRVFVVILV